MLLYDCLGQHAFDSGARLLVTQISEAGTLLEHRPLREYRRRLHRERSRERSLRTRGISSQHRGAEYKRGNRIQAFVLDVGIVHEPYNHPACFRVLIRV
jgi:hypothetical protein